MQKALTVSIAEPAIFKKQMLHWAAQRSICAFYDNHHYHTAPFHRFDCLVAAGAEAICLPAERPLQALDQFVEQHSGRWLFGHLGFGLKDHLFAHLPAPAARPGFSDLGFFVPEVVLQLQGRQLTIEAAQPEAVWQSLQQPLPPAPPLPPVDFSPLLSRQAYLARIEQVLAHIARGDCYELNYCQAFEAHAQLQAPWQVYDALARLSPVPFAAYYRWQQNHLLCASPERFLQRQGGRLISQPIKGTAPRHPANAAADAAEGQALQQSAKNRSENVMVVDLVRNDLSRICLPGTVQATELCGLHSFPQVHQLISTVEGLAPAASLGQVLAVTFPMGSMTGAPKQRVLEIVDALEPAARGLYSGSVGYVMPNSDFDFNVVIRSLQYQAQTQHLSYHVGGAITAYSQPQEEYEECLLKAQALRRLFA